MLGRDADDRLGAAYCRDAQQTPGLEGEFRVKCCSEWFNSASDLAVV